MKRPPFVEEALEAAQGVPTSVLPDLLTCLVLLRWADSNEEARATQAHADGRPFVSLLPRHLRWRHWKNLGQSALGLFWENQLVPGLGDLREGEGGRVGGWLRTLANGAGRLYASDFILTGVFIRWFGSRPFETIEDRRRFLDAYDALLGFAEDGQAGEFSSLAGVAELAAAIADPAPGESVYDPCFGTGGLLLAAHRHAARRDDPAPTHEPNRAAPTLLVSGIEKNQSAFLNGLARLLLAGVAEPRLENADSLLHSPEEAPFNIVLANPPIGHRAIPADAPNWPVQSTDATTAFLYHTLAQLRPGGRAVVLVPESALYRAGATRDLRQHLVEQRHLEAVIGLPQHSLSRTSLKCSLLVLRKGAAPDFVRSVDGTSFFEPGTSRRPPALTTDNFRKLVSLIRGTLPGPAINVYRSTFSKEQVAQWGYVLRPPGLSPEVVTEGVRKAIEGLGA